MAVQVTPSYVEVLASNNNAADFYLQLTGPPTAMVIIELEVSCNRRMYPMRKIYRGGSLRILTGTLLSTLARWMTTMRESHSPRPQ